MDERSGLDVLRPVLIARHPIIALDSFEEDRVERALEAVAKSRFQTPVPLFTWSVTRGLRGPDGVVPESQAPLKALAAIAARREGAVYLFRDLHRHFDDPRVIRTLRELRPRLIGTARLLFLQGPQLTLPVELRRDVALIDFPLPGIDELGALLDRHLQGRPPLDPDMRRHLVTALRGLTATEATHALHIALHARDAIDDRALTALQDQKAQLARKEGVLEYVPQRWHLDDIGGLATLKDWFHRRRTLFEDPDAAARGLTPRGVLVMGIPGCGKSLTIKAISALWNLPLFRLDMGQVFGGIHGTPEETFRRALWMMESVAPAILWIDEIENGISAESTGSDAGVKGRIFATFLTWMQEKPADVFVGATANRIDLLPAELLRKGRFDQVFFIDLPEEDERAEIFRVHLRRRGENVERFNATTLAKATKGWNGAEIEAAVTAAIVDAKAEGRPVAEDDFFLQVGKMVPLAKTMAEQIKAIRSWAHQRAIRAN
ncbi:MAG: AAA family ATPase [Myxococcales bacterium]|nr:AAA family ATPase [Myxococcales bacterium]MCB9551653.1 AAA family ATPase [Myxococcales bacterium]